VEVRHGAVGVGEGRASGVAGTRIAL